MFGDKVQRKENLAFEWLAHGKFATMVAKIRPVRVTHRTRGDVHVARDIFQSSRYGSISKPVRARSKNYREVKPETRISQWINGY